VPVVRAAALVFHDLPGRRAADPLPDDAGTEASVRVVRITPGPRRPHMHPHSAEVVYVAEGTGTAWEGDIATHVSAGDLVIVPRGVPHATVATGQDDLVLVCFFPHPDLPSNILELSGPVRD